MMEIEQETIYGTHEDSHVVMSEKVQSLAGSIYQEFEKMIGKYDQEVVKDLMPLVVNVLECLDLSYTENQEHEVELELLREDNEQLVTQYEREKQLRKATEQKLLEVEDANEDERKDLNGKIESLESIVRMLELKSKNASDHVFRLEEKENEQKREYSKLHERYTELFKTHMDYMERTKILMGSAERLEGDARSRLPAMSLGPLNRSTGPVSFGFASLEASMRSVGTPSEFGAPVSPPDSNHSNTSLRNELQDSNVTPLSPEDLACIPRETSDKSQLTETVTMEDRGTLARGGWTDGISPSTKESTPELEEVEDLSSTNVVHTPSSTGRTKTKKEQRSANTLYQELSFQDAEALSEMDDGADITGSWVHPGEYASSVNDNFFGMGKEVENLIMENNELLATKNALNIVKDDLILKVDELTSEHEILREEQKSLHAVKGKLKQRIAELEDEVRRTKEEVERANKAAKSDDEEDVPMAQRKRFTRVEMARVLMERNQYKERFMELQEAVRWTEMIRASRIDPLDKKNKHSIWNFFSNLISTSKSGASGERVPRKSMVYVQYNAPTHQVSPGALGSMRKRTLTDRKRPLGDYIDGEISSEKLAARRASERKEQYRQVRAHVRKDDGRLQAYGWSLPAKTGGTNNSVSISAQPPTSLASSTSSNSGRIPVPVPIYCRPLAEKEPGMKVWCAAGVNLSGGRTRDGGSVVGASVFYTSPTTSSVDPYSLLSDSNKDKEDLASEVDQLEAELREGERIAKESVSYEQKLSSLVWICTSSNTTSKVTVIDANNPADVLESFIVCQSNLLCIASVPGAHENDYDTTSDNLNLNEQKSTTPVPHESTLDKGNEESHSNEEPSSNLTTDDGFDIGRITFVSCASGSEAPDQVHTDQDVIDDIFPPITPRTRLVKEVSPVVKDGLSDPSTDNDLALSELGKMSSVLPTMWLGSQKGHLYIHSAVAHWSHCLHSIRLTDSVLSIVHVQGRVVVALADGKVAVFARRSDGQWNLDAYHLVDIGRPGHHSIRCMAGVHGRVWCGYRNNIHVLDPKTLTIEKSLVAHPRKESQVRQMAWLGDGVWVSIRLDSTLRLYHAHTYEHLQDVDIEPYVSKMLGTGKLGFSFVRITTLLISSGRLWIGTGNGVIISVPLADNSVSSSNTLVATRATPRTCQAATAPGGVVRVYSDPGGTRVTPATFIPYCSMAQAQLSFHGHRDAVKFFVAVPGIGSISSNNSAASSSSQVSAIVAGEVEKSRSPSMLVMAGGEGYIDFRAGDGDEDIESEVDQQEPSREPQHEQIYLIVWQVTSHE